MNPQQYFEGAGVRLTAKVHGDSSAPPILFLHATCQTCGAWERAANLVAQRGFFGIALDLRGHGNSEWAPDGQYTSKSFASDIVAILDRFDQPVTIVGNSMGGLTALAAGAQRPDRVRLLVSFDAAPTMTLPGNKKYREFFEMAARGFDSVEQVVKEMEVRFDRPVSDIARFRTRFVERDGRVFFRWDPKVINIEAAESRENQEWLLGLLQGFEKPVVLMLAEHNSLVSRDALVELREAVPQLVVERWQGTRHDMTTSDSVRIASRTLAHLSRLDGQSVQGASTALA